MLKVTMENCMCGVIVAAVVENCIAESCSAAALDAASAEMSAMSLAFSCPLLVRRRISCQLPDEDKAHGDNANEGRVQHVNLRALGAIAGEVEPLDAGAVRAGSLASTASSRGPKRRAHIPSHLHR